MSKPAVADLDVWNFAAVGVAGDQLGVMNPRAVLAMDADRALILAAWLVTLADDTPGGERFAAILARVRNT